MSDKVFLTMSRPFKNVKAGVILGAMEDHIYVRMNYVRMSPLEFQLFPLWMLVVCLFD